MIRPVGADALPFLEAMLLEAVCWRAAAPGGPPVEEVLADPQVALYVEGWGRTGDAGVVAVDGGQPVGAAWYRLFTVDRPGLGFVDEQTPELSIGVLAGARGRGEGTELLRALLQQATAAGFRTVSLSVE
ncbi:MAG TPA: GNAT family N-acetyltransferase, partial [Gaiellaceae bacterium]|nr:GNAT family N-acetyltransferase [Gaiellaceae bacterium]